MTVEISASLEVLLEVWKWTSSKDETPSCNTPNRPCGLKCYYYTLFFGLFRYLVILIRTFQNDDTPFLAQTKKYHE